MEHRHWQDWVSGAVGLWLIVCPFLLTFSLGEATPTTMITANFVICGGLALLLALAVLAAFRIWEEWLTVALGIWLIISPWMLDFAASRSATWNAVGAGIVLAVFAGWTLVAAESESHA